MGPILGTGLAARLLGDEMNSEIAHWLLTAGLGLFSLLLTGFAVVLWSNLRDIKSDVGSLQRQNDGQERELATLKANHENHASGMQEVRDTLRELRDAIQQLMLRLGYRNTPYTAGESGRKT